VVTEYILIAFCERYADHFQLKTREIGPQAQQYLCGLMQSNRKNMERMAEVVPESDEQSLQHFLSNSNWDDRAVLDQVAMEVDQQLGGDEDSALLLDESGFTKKGRSSVGVARQYNGRLGKQDNCQVGVFAALNCKDRVSLIDNVYISRNPGRMIRLVAMLSAYRRQPACSKPNRSWRLRWCATTEP
jgi:SRSO17 transposase